MTHGHPNIIHISWHDVGRMLGCYGISEVDSPHVDRLATEGMRFSNYWATSSICSPSRACALTGRYPQMIGVSGLCHAPECYSLTPGEKHVSHLMRDAGWYTTLIGWQHETTHDKVHADLGFHEVHHNDPMPECDVIADATTEWLRQRVQMAEGQPFYLQVGFLEIHRSRSFGCSGEGENEIHIPPYLEPSEAARQGLAQQHQAIRKADAGVGTILAAIDEMGLRENTLVIFTSDHGIGFPRAKTTLYDPGVGIPLVVRWPARGVEGGTTCDWLLSNVDFLPTLLELIGIDTPGNLHGSSFAGVFDGSQKMSPRDEVHAIFINSHRMVRTASHKLIWNLRPTAYLEAPVCLEHPRRLTAWPVWELYDLRSDRLEAVNLAAEPPITHPGDHQQRLDAEWAIRPSQPETEQEMKQRLWGWMERIGDPLLEGPVADPYLQRVLAEAGDAKRRSRG
jgi:arylsulfatase A-like enzyme